jgi:tripartite-type tricarboxylate transporter receptor subunit TctC
MTHHQAPKASAVRVSRRSFTAAASLAACGVTGSALAQDRFPSKPIRLLCGSPAGSLSDILARLTAQKLGESLKQPVVVDNRPGANGTVVGDATAKSPPDGYTLMLVPDTVMVVNQFVYPRLPYNPETDLQSVAFLGRVALLLVVNPNTGIKNFNEFVRAAKAQPKKLNYGSGGQGHPTHLIMELMANRLGFEVQHVPYKGTAPAIQAVASGEVNGMIVGLAEALPMIKAGRITAIAASGPNAKEMFPELPLFRDAHKDLDATVWFGIFGPAHMPPATVALLNTEINKVLQDPEAVKRFADFGMKPLPGAPAVMDEIMKRERVSYGPLVKSLGLKAE